MAEKTRYSDEELEEFKELIQEKLDVAKRDYDAMMASLMNRDNNGVDDTSPTYKAMEEGANTGLQAALVRIENKTYGICRETGKLIPKERLRAVPHATLCIEAKNVKNRKD